MRAINLLLSLSWMLALAACGGSGPQAAPASPVDTLAPPVAHAPPSGPSDAGAGHPPQPASAPDAAQPRFWALQWREPWESPLILGGWVRHSLLDCAGGAADPDRPPEGAFGGGYAWSAFGGVIGTAQARDGSLHIDSPQQAGGYALLTNRTWAIDRPLAVQATVTLQPDPGAWLGLALIADETDYRELSLYEAGGRVGAGVWHPCKIEWGVGHYEAGPRTLRLEYTPGEAVCWRHYIDGQMVSSERCSVPGAPLASPARVGLYVVNLLAEAQRIPGQVRATVGSVTVEVAR